jgi:hypothetical protein
MERNILKVLDVSTSHISESDNEKLLGQSMPQFKRSINPLLMVDKLPNGFLIHINENTQTVFNELEFDHGLNKMSYGFIKLLHVAISENFDLIKLDCDGSVYSDLPTFEW